MPAPVAAMLKQNWKTLFKSKAIGLPTEFKNWTEQSQKELWKPSDNRPPRPMSLFRAATTNQYHNKTDSEVDEGFNRLIDKVSDGICSQWSTFHSSAKFVASVVNGPIGIYAPATLMPPGMMSGPLIYARCNAFSEKPNFQRIANAICTAFGTAFCAWQTGLGFYSVPYPSGAVQCTTMIPCPNIPVPLVTGISPGEAMMMKPALYGVMLGMCSPPGNHVMALLDAASTALNAAFMQWKGTTMVTQVICGGGVAPPPPSPPGPVVAALGGGGMLT